MRVTSHGPMTRSELDAWPDDGRRHELIDGVLVVTPVPPLRHQRALMNLFWELEGSLPDDLEMLFGPLDVVLADDAITRPDLLVARRHDFTDADLPGAPLLAVEITCPSTRLVDLELKRARYEAAGCPSYWVLDPDQVQLHVCELGEDGRYGPGRVTSGGETITLTAPYPVELTPEEIVHGGQL